MWLEKCLVKAKDHMKIRGPLVPPQNRLLLYHASHLPINTLDFFLYLKSLWGEVKTAPKCPSESIFKEKGEVFLNIKICFHPR